MLSVAFVTSLRRHAPLRIQFPIRRSNDIFLISQLMQPRPPSRTILVFSGVTVASISPFLFFVQRSASIRSFSFQELCSPRRERHESTRSGRVVTHVGPRVVARDDDPRLTDYNLCYLCNTRDTSFLNNERTTLVDHAGAGTSVRLAARAH